MSLKQLDCWIAFNFKHGRFPGSLKLIAIPQVKTPSFLKTDIPISPIDLLKKFAGSDAKSTSVNSSFGCFEYSFWWK